jgi:GNAT superfamily N-acetyltransferase
VYIDRAHRRHGLARRLVDAARQFVANDGAYRIIYLHTHPDTPGAEPFWRSVASREVHNDRDSGGLEVRGRRFITIHFEIDLPLT